MNIALKIVILILIRVICNYYSNEIDDMFYKLYDLPVYIKIIVLTIFLITHLSYFNRIITGIDYILNRIWF